MKFLIRILALLGGATLLINLTTIGMLHSLEASSSSDSYYLPKRQASPFLPGEKETSDAQYIHDRCGVAGEDAKSRVEGYVSCFVDEMNRKPQRLCDSETKGRFIRYTRIYFADLDERRAGSATEAEVDQAARLIGWENLNEDMKNSGVRDNGNASVIAPSEETMQQYVRLAEIGAYALSDFGGFLAYDAPLEISQALAKVKASKKVCK